jgi:hypothetical protein
MSCSARRDDSAPLHDAFPTTVRPRINISESIELRKSDRMAPKKSQPSTGPTIPAAARPTYDAIAGLTDAFCQEHLNAEYEAMCCKLAGVLARKRPSTLVRGKPQVWACAIVRVIGWVNFLDDSSQTPHTKLTANDKAFGVPQATGQIKSKAIRDLLQIRTFDPHWTLPSRMDQNPVAWMITVNGLIVDAQHLQREIQEAAFRQGLIPYIPGERGKAD